MDLLTACCSLSTSIAASASRFSCSILSFSSCATARGGRSRRVMPLLFPHRERTGTCLKRQKLLAFEENGLGELEAELQRSLLAVALDPARQGFRLPRRKNSGPSGSLPPHPP